MKTRITFLLASCIFMGCSLSQPRHEAGVPYYFKSGVTYQGVFPTGEISKREAEKLNRAGYAYCVAFFDQAGDPCKILRVYQEETTLYWQYENAAINMPESRSAEDEDDDSVR